MADLRHPRGVAWWQLIHDVRLETEYEDPRRERRSFLHRDDEVPSQPLVWDKALESPELRTYNEYLRALADRGGRKTWGNPRGLPEDALAALDDVDGPGRRELPLPSGGERLAVAPPVRTSRPGPRRGRALSGLTRSSERFV